MKHLPFFSELPPVVINQIKPFKYIDIREDALFIKSAAKIGIPLAVTVKR